MKLLSVDLFTYEYVLSFIKFSQKLRNKYMEKQMYHFFFWTCCEQVFDSNFNSLLS